MELRELYLENPAVFSDADALAKALGEGGYDKEKAKALVDAVNAGIMDDFAFIGTEVHVMTFHALSYRLRDKTTLSIEVARECVRELILASGRVIVGNVLDGLNPPVEEE